MFFLKYLFNKKRKQSGFSLVETMVGVGLMAGVGLTVAQLAKQSNEAEKRVSQSTSTYQIFNTIQRNLQDKAACKNTLRNINIPLGGTATIGEIRNRNNQRVISLQDRFNATGSKIDANISNAPIQLTTMRLDRLSNESVLRVELTVNHNNQNKTLRKSIPLFVEYNSANQVLGCESDISNNIDDAVEAALNAACKGEGLSFDPITKKCRVIPQFGSNPSICSDPNQTVVATLIDPVSKQYTFTCEDTIKFPNSCGNNEVLKRDENNVFSCVKMSCENGGLFQSVSGETVTCIECNSGDAIFGGTGSPCGQPTFCGINATNPSYMSSFGISGAGTCKPLLSSNNSACTNGQLQVQNDGSVQYQCCTPQCAKSPSNICADSPEVSLNGCGLCQGTRQPDCSDASNYCSGTPYPSSNGCGTCVGSKTPVNGQWVIISESEKRDKPGAVCSYLMVVGDMTISDYLYTKKSAPDLTYQDPCMMDPYGNCVYLTSGGSSGGGTSGPITTGGTPITTTGGSSGLTTGGTTGIIKDPVPLKKYMPVEKKVVRSCVGQVCGGAPCVGPTEYWEHDSYRECVETPAPINGGWSAWSAWSTCSAGKRTRTRTCSNPAPAHGGADCIGNTTEIQICSSKKCYVSTSTRVISGSSCYQMGEPPFEGSQCTTDSDCLGYVRTNTVTSPVDGCRYEIKYQATCGGGLGPIDDLEPIPVTGGTAGGCFIAGSEVTMSDGRQMPIEQVLKGDILIDSNGNSNQVKDLIRLNYSGSIFGINGGEPFFTPNHPFKTLDGWKSLDPETTKKEIPDIKVKKLQIGDVLVKENGYEILMSLEKTDNVSTIVYNFELDGTREYLVNEYSVHNKKMCPVAPIISWDQDYVVCQCPMELCPTYHVIQKGQFYACPACL